MEKQSKLPKLPAGIRPADLKFPRSRQGLKPSHYRKLEELGLPSWGTEFSLWYSERWMIPTVNISGKSSREAERTYAIGVDDKKCYRIGGGPHVTAKVRVYLTAANFDRLFPFLQLQEEGKKQAGKIRDRISSRRAQGQIYRAQGLRHWRW